MVFHYTDGKGPEHKNSWYSQYAEESIKKKCSRFGWDVAEESIVLGGTDGAEGGKARVHYSTFPVTPHPLPAARYPFPVLPP